MKKLFLFVFAIFLFFIIGYSMGFAMGPPVEQEIGVVMAVDNSAVVSDVIASENAGQMNIIMICTAIEGSIVDTDCEDSVAMFILIGFFGSEQARSSVCWYKSTVGERLLII